MSAPAASWCDKSTYWTQSQVGRWRVYGNLCRHTPEAGAVCGKAARTDLCGGRAMKRTSLPLRAATSACANPGRASCY